MFKEQIKLKNSREEQAFKFSLIKDGRTVSIF